MAGRSGLTLVGEFESSSNPDKARIVKLNPLTGELSCNCPGWVFKRGAAERRCRHLDKAWELGWVDIAAGEQRVALDTVWPKKSGLVSSRPDPKPRDLFKIPDPAAPIAAPVVTRRLRPADTALGPTVPMVTLDVVRGALQQAGVNYLLTPAQVRCLAHALAPHMKAIVHDEPLPVVVAEASISFAPGRRRIIFD